MATNYAVTATKGKGRPKKVIREDLMNKYHFVSASTAANNHIEGVLYTNKAMNTSTGLISDDTLTITIVDGT